jgi:hypothetical protein
MAYDDFGLDDDFGSDDELGMDELGAMSERKLARLLRLRSKLVAQLPLVGPARQKAIKTRLMQIDRILAKSGYTAQKQAAATALAASGIEGVGGLSFQAMSPPGIGRLVRLPFYPVNATLNVVTSTSTAVTGNTSSTTNPVFIEIPGAGTSGNAAHILQTPQISWATLRIVGFEVAQKLNCAIQAPGPILLVEDLKIGGGANLFTHEDFADADIYSADQPEFCGLRDYPILKSPNTAVVTVQMLNDVTGESMTVSCSLLCEVLVDDNYGAHIPGPYARGGSLVRQGGSFVNR